MSSSNFLTLFDGQGANGTSDSVLYKGRSQTCLLYIEGDIGGGTLDIEIKPEVSKSVVGEPTLAFVDIAGGKGLTDVECKTLFLPAFTHVRAELSGSTSPDLTVGIFYQ